MLPQPNPNLTMIELIITYRSPLSTTAGAACGLLQEAYQSRDKICLIPFQGNTNNNPNPKPNPVYRLSNRS